MNSTTEKVTRQNFEFKGTPGPWFIREYPSDLIHIAKGSEENILEDFCTVWNTSKPQRMENAKAMAAAPDLLEFARMIYYMSEDTGRDGCSYGDTDYDSQSVVYGHNKLLEYLRPLAEKILIKALK